MVAAEVAAEVVAEVVAEVAVVVEVVVVVVAPRVAATVMVGALVLLFLLRQGRMLCEGLGLSRNGAVDANEHVHHYDQCDHSGNTLRSDAELREKTLCPPHQITEHVAKAGNNTI